jgi:hypothetical protein
VLFEFDLIDLSPKPEQRRNYHYNDKEPGQGDLEIQIVDQDEDDNDGGDSGAYRFNASVHPSPAIVFEYPDGAKTR